MSFKTRKRKLLTALSKTTRVLPSWASWLCCVNRARKDSVFQADRGCSARLPAGLPPDKESCSALAGRLKGRAGVLWTQRQISHTDVGGLTQSLSHQSWQIYLPCSLPQSTTHSSTPQRLSPGSAPELLWPLIRAQDYIVLSVLFMLHVWKWHES